MKSQIKILGNKIDCFPDYRSFYNLLAHALKTGSKTGYITVNNVHTMIEGYRDKSYQAIINNSYFSIPDGKPLEIVGKLKGNNEISRLFGPTVMENFIDWGRNDNFSHFFFGSSEANLQKLRTAIETNFPGAKVAGILAPPYAPVDEWENGNFIKIINDTKPDFIWIGLGAPKQERWMFQFANEIKYGIMFGIGAGFDYLAGSTKHAPVWMKNMSLEWLYRLIQEPKRLWKRYFTTIPPFMFFATLELLGVKLKNRK